MPQRYQIYFARLQTELVLTESESMTATRELYQTLLQVATLNGDDLSYTQKRLNVLQVAQLFDVGEVNQALELPY